MVIISENLRNLINADSRSFNVRLKNGDDIFENIISLKKSVVFPSSSMSVGNALCTCIECTASDIPVSITGKKLEAEITIYESAEWIKLGSFTAQKPTVQDGNVTFTAYDAMDKASNQIYNSTLSAGSHTAAEYFEDICTQLNEPFVLLDEASVGLEIAEDKLSGYSCRDALSYLAGFLGQNCIVNRDGRFEMVGFMVVDYDMLNPDRIADPELSDADSIISYLACCIDEETTLMSGEGSTGFEFISPLMTQDRLDDIYNALCNVDSPVKAYKSGRITQLLGDPTLDICDVISLSYEGKAYEIPIMSLVLDFDGGLQAEIESFDLAEPNSLSLGERLSFEQKQAKEKTEGYVNAMVEFSQAIQKAYGVTNTVIGGITYFHDKEKIEESGYIFCMTGKGIAFSDSWGGSHEKTVWKYGINNDGEAVLNMLKVFKIKADLIEAGQITSSDEKTFFNLDEGIIGSEISSVDEEGNKIIEYLYRQSAKGVRMETDPAISFAEFEATLTEEEQSEIDRIRAMYPGNSAFVTVMRNLFVMLVKWVLWGERTKGFCISCRDIDSEVCYNYNFSGNSSTFTQYHYTQNKIKSTIYSADGIKSDGNFVIDAPSIELRGKMPWLNFDENTWATTGTFQSDLEAVFASMPMGTCKKVQLIDPDGLNAQKFVGEIWKYTDGYGVVTAVNYSGYKAVKTLYDNVWQPWEWEIPPMESGVEYRTTEHYEGLPVYVQCGTIGSLPNTSTVKFKVGNSGDIIRNLVELSVQAISTSDSNIKHILPIIGGKSEIQAKVSQSNTREFTIQTYTNLSGYTAKYKVKYTK